MNKFTGKTRYQGRNFEIAQIAGGGKNESLIIFRGYQGFNLVKDGRSHSYARWGQAFRNAGFEGRIYNYRWPSELVDGLGLELACREAEKCFWNIVDIDQPESISLIGFSSGGRIIQKILRRMSRLSGNSFNNVFLIGSLARSDDCWPLLLRSVSGKIHNFYSIREETLSSWYVWLLYSHDISGLQKIPFKHWRIENYDCSSLVKFHSDWEESLEILIERTGIDPGEL